VKSDAKYLVVGAGMSGLSFANAIRAEAAGRGKPAADVMVIEADDEPGGYCKTVKREGFTWDYSGHFFHFVHPEIEQWLRERMPDGEVATITKRAFIRFKGLDVDFPFQKNIHQLAREDFIDCLYDLYFRDESPGSSGADNFKTMLYRRFGRGIAERFLVPYNEKLYATDLVALDVDAMGRFFPQADVADIIRNMRRPDNTSYNSTFTYPRGGAIEYVKAMLRDLPADCISYGERLVAVDLARRVAKTSRREIRFERLISSAPLPDLIRICNVPVDERVFSWNKVLAFNLGFDRKGPSNAHWMYFPDPSVSFYRVGFYDNIWDDPRMSLYVEIGLPRNAPVDVEKMQGRVLADLAREHVVDGHRLVASHHVVMDPAYVHINGSSRAEVARLRPVLADAGVHPVGRYGGWTYCAIEDNIVETRALAQKLGDCR
jgi:protoporphyrinogen oxidase